MSVQTCRKFELRFDPRYLNEYANRYPVKSDEQMRGYINIIRDRGYLLKNEFLMAARWKSQRIVHLAEECDEKEIKAKTAIFLTNHGPLNKGAMGIFLDLRGVSYPMASVIAHWFHKDDFPILDYRALWSLGYENPPHYNFNFWEYYVSFCRNLANENRISMRTLDRGLWQYSKENQK